MYHAKKDLDELQIESRGNISILFPIKPAYHSLDLDSVNYIQKFWKNCVATGTINMAFINPENPKDEQKLTENQHMHMIFRLVLDKLFANESKCQQTINDALMADELMEVSTTAKQTFANESFNYKNKFDLYCDKANFFYEHNYRPDFVFIMKDKPYKPNFCSFLVELQLSKHIDDDHKGRAILYNTHALKSTPTRHKILTVVSNLNEFIIIESTRTDKSEDFKHFESLPMNFWDEGLKCLFQMLSEPTYVGFDDKLTFSFKIKSDNSDEQYYPSCLLGKSAKQVFFVNLIVD